MKIRAIDMRILMIFLVNIYFFSSLVIPLSFVNKVVFGLIIVLYFIVVSISGNIKLNSFYPIVIIIIFLYGFVRSFGSDSDLSLSTQFFLTSTIFLLIYPIVHYKMDLNKVSKIFGLVIVILTGIVYCIVHLNITFPGSDLLLKILNEYGNVHYGFRDFTGIPLKMVRFGTISFMYLPAYLFFKDFLLTRRKRHLLFFILSFLTILVSTSRGLVLGLIITLLLVFLLNQKNSVRFFYISMLIPLMILVGTYLISSTTIFSSNEASNSIKIGHVQSAVDNFNILNVILGDGLGSYYYSKGVNEYLAHTEITLLDNIRYFGFPLTFVLYYALLFPIRKISQYFGKSSETLLVFLMYLIISLTNPVLFNSTGSLIVLWYWATIVSEIKYGQKYTD